jgi:hypothetical protein
MMRDKMRYGNFSSPNQWNVQDSPSIHDDNYFDDIDEEDNVPIHDETITGPPNIPSPSIYIINYYNDINK